MSLFYVNLNPNEMALLPESLGSSFFFSSVFFLVPRKRRREEERGGELSR